MIARARKLALSILTCPVPGSVNFCHDLVIRSERQVCTMLCSRRYEPEAIRRPLPAEAAPIDDAGFSGRTRAFPP